MVFFLKKKKKNLKSTPQEGSAQTQPYAKNTLLSKSRAALQIYELEL